jgi:hypothetical protein
VSDFFDPVRLDPESFDDLLQKLDLAFAQNQAALVMRDGPAAPEVVILTNEVGLTTSQSTASEFLDQLLFFGMTDAPDDVIRTWASNYDASLAEQAVERARALARSLPHVAAVWKTKSWSFAPQLARLRSEVVVGSDGEPRALLSLASALLRFGLQPDPFSRRELLVQLHPTDVAYLQAELELVSSEIASVTSREEA